jgi:hypothetical protein
MTAYKVSGNAQDKLLSWAGLMRESHILVEAQSEALAEVMIALIAEGFNKERDPYGRKWAKKKKPDGRKVLHGETTRLRNGWHVKSNRRGFRVAPSVTYAAHHQAPRFGRRPTRMMVPSGSRGLPRRWRDEMATVAIAVAKATYGARAGGSARGGLSIAKIIRIYQRARSLARKAGVL